MPLPVRLSIPYGAISQYPFAHPSSAFFFFMIRPPPTSTLFPYTTLFRSPHKHFVATKGVRAVVIDHVVGVNDRSEEHTSELQSLRHLVCRLLLEKKKKNNFTP